jgi:arylsulfatase A-like enzyme
MSVRSRAAALEVPAASLPYTPEMLGWNTFFEKAALGPLAASFAMLVDSRAAYLRRLIEEREADAAVAVITATDRAQHGFWKFRDPQAYWDIDDPTYRELAPSAREVGAYGSVIERVYEAADDKVGEMLRLTDGETLVVLLSDHGFKSGRHEFSPSAGVHDTRGIYVIARGGGAAMGASPAAVTRRDGEELRLLDVLPTVLAGLGLPIARDFAGNVARDVLDSVATPAWRMAGAGQLLVLESYEQAARHTKDGKTGRMDATIHEQLRSLGYLQ